MTDLTFLTCMTNLTLMTYMTYLTYSHLQSKHPPQANPQFTFQYFIFFQH